MGEKRPNIILVPLLGALVAAEDLEADCVNPGILTSLEVLWLEVPSAGFNLEFWDFTFLIFVFSFFEELAAYNTGVSLLRLIDHEVVVIEVEGDHKLSSYILRLDGVHNSGESELDLVVNPLEIVLFLGLGDKSEAVTQRVFLISEVVVRGDLKG